MKSFERKDRYSGQALAIVLIVIVVAAIIALAIMSRVRSEQRNVTDERSSSQSLSVSEDLLDAVTALPMGEIAELINGDHGANSLDDLCESPGTLDYEFWENGCILDDTEEVMTFLQSLDDVYVSSDSVFSVIATQMEAELTASCGGNEHEVEMTILPIEEGEELILQEGVVLSLIPDTIPSGACDITVNANRIRDGVKSGIIESAIYSDDVLGFAEYDYPLSKGYCLFDCLSDLSWVGANNTNGWVNSPTGTTFTRPLELVQSGDTFGLNELRLRPIGDDVAISYTTSPTECIELKQIMKLRVVTSCSGVSQGKETLIPRENWTPSIFDYTIYNGQGVFEYELY
jgi:hypothetical protein